MTLKQLHALIAVFEERSFSLAAKRLNIVQPALSQQIIGLEKELDVRLFRRSNRGVEVTADGQRLIHHANLILRQVEIAGNDLRSAREQEPAGDVIFAMPFTMTTLLSPRLIVWLEQRYPKINLRIVEGLSSESGHVVETGQVELGIVPNVAELREVDSIPVLREFFYLHGRVGRPEDSGGDITLAEAARVPLTLGDREHNLRRVIDEHIAAINVQLNVRYLHNAPRTLNAIIDQGLACTISNYARSVDESGVVRFSRRIVKPEMSRLVSVGWARRRPLSKPAECVREGILALMVEAVEAGDWKAELIAHDSESKKMISKISK